ncbi:DUF2695 domain-containing protein [Brevibacterium atlanticum]|uniref:DUF2695 domain-containing protein n=1 Tax=Brevibacterium atlanticum TaxID=2697563 RepID=UPI001421771C|nr:DUF2695 domain-containing protein [Brevibacterium atlanticum]
MDKNTIDTDIRTIIDTASDRILAPRPGECLVCYVHRQLSEFGCNGTRRFALTFRDQTAPRATALLDRLSSLGACCCDGQIILDAFTLGPHPWILDPGPFAEALGTPIRIVDVDENMRIEDIDETQMTVKYLCCKIVRRGSTQPCGNWVRQSGRD